MYAIRSYYGIGMLKGFAITTIAGVLMGISISSVITSYSIHYTKLYDYAISCRTPPRVLKRRRSVGPAQISVATLLVVETDMTHFRAAVVHAGHVHGPVVDLARDECGQQQQHDDKRNNFV